MKTQGTHEKQLLNLSKQIRDYLASKSIIIAAEYLSGHLNLTADRVFCNFQEQKLFPQLFFHIFQNWVDPIPNIFCLKFPERFQSTWHRSDTKIWLTDDIYQSRAKMFPQAFSLLSLIFYPQVLSKLFDGRDYNYISGITMANTGILWSFSKHVSLQHNLYFHIEKNFCQIQQENFM